MYIPKSQIKENQYTSGKEFTLSTTGKVYIGSYYSTSKGEFFTGKNTNDTPNIKLNKIVDSNNPYNIPTIEIANQVESYYLTDPSYAKAKKLPKNRTPGRIPIQSLPTPTEKNIKDGFLYRYFVKKGNESKFIEISELEYNKFKNQDNSVLWQLYTPIKIQWDIQGDREQVYNGNKTVVSLTEQRQSVPGFTLFFRGKFDKFWIGK